MPSKSKKQQRFFQLVKAVQNGDVKRKDVTKGVRDAAGSMSKRQVSDFADHISRRKKKVNDGILRFEDFTTLGICEERINNPYNKFKNMIHIKRINEMIETPQPDSTSGKEKIIKTKGGEVRAWMDDKVASDVNGYGEIPNGVDGALDFLTKVCIEAEHDGYAELMYNGNAGWEIQDYNYNTMGFLAFERGRKSWTFQRYSMSEAPTKLIADFEIAVRNQVQ